MIKNVQDFHFLVEIKVTEVVLVFRRSFLSYRTNKSKKKKLKNYPLYFVGLMHNITRNIFDDDLK